jgi:hypothetical protein
LPEVVAVQEDHMELQVDQHLLAEAEVVARRVPPLQVMQILAAAVAVALEEFQEEMEDREFWLLDIQYKLFDNIMAYFAEIDENGIVLRVVVIDNEQEHRGQDFLSDDLNLGGIWLQTSYNTHGGTYYDPGTNEPSLDQSKSYRKNYAGVGFVYDPIRDAFIPPKPFDSWILNEETCWWEPPIPMPKTGGPWQWNEELEDWEQVLED